MTKTHTLLSLVLCVSMAGAGLRAQPPSNGAGSSAISTEEYANLADDNYSYPDHLRRYAHRKYGPMMAQLHDSLSEAKHQRLWEILEARELSVNGRNREGDLPAMRTSFDQQIRAELGDDIADNVSGYIQTIAARGLLARVNVLLLYRGKPLSPEQMDKLCQDMTQQAALVPRDVETMADIRTFTEQRLARDGKILSNAKDYLTPHQLEALSEELEFQISAIKIGMLNSLARKQHGK